MRRSIDFTHGFCYVNEFFLWLEGFLSDCSINNIVIINLIIMIYLFILSFYNVSFHSFKGGLIIIILTLRSDSFLTYNDDFLTINIFINLKNFFNRVLFFQFFLVDFLHRWLAWFLLTAHLIILLDNNRLIQIYQRLLNWLDNNLSLILLLLLLLLLDL